MLVQVGDLPWLGTRARLRTMDSGLLGPGGILMPFSARRNSGEPLGTTCASAVGDLLLSASLRCRGPSGELGLRGTSAPAKFPEWSRQIRVLCGVGAEWWLKFPSFRPPISATRRGTQGGPGEFVQLAQAWDCSWLHAREDARDQLTRPDGRAGRLR